MTNTKEVSLFPMRNDLDFEQFKTKTIKAAIELCYEEGTLKLLKNAKNENELTRIMNTARKRG